MLAAAPRGPAATLEGVTTRGSRETTADAGLTVGAAAARVGVTVRTLHHWDAIGLVRPSRRTDSGYRLYTAEDLARVHRVLVYRELDVPLGEIGRLLDAPTSDATASLRRQRDQLRERAGRLQRMAVTLDRLIEARQSGLPLTAQQQVAIFGEHWQPSWAEGARERWGETVQWAQHAERAAGRSAEDWQEIADAAEALHAELAEAYRAGVLAGSAAANGLAERHRASMDAYFDCTHAMHVCVGRLYTADPGFAAFFDGIEDGLAAWLRDVIDANARHHGTDPESATWT